MGAKKRGKAAGDAGNITGVATALLALLSAGALSGLGLVAGSDIADGPGAAGLFPRAQDVRPPASVVVPGVTGPPSGPGTGTGTGSDPGSGSGADEGAPTDGTGAPLQLPDVAGVDAPGGSGPGGSGPAPGTPLPPAPSPGTPLPPAPPPAPPAGTTLQSVPPVPPLSAGPAVAPVPVAPAAVSGDRHGKGKPARQAKQDRRRVKEERKQAREDDKADEKDDKHLGRQQEKADKPQPAGTGGARRDGKHDRDEDEQAPVAPLAPLPVPTASSVPGQNEDDGYDTEPSDDIDEGSDDDSDSEHGRGHANGHDKAPKENGKPDTD